jgi:hypothetical protein
MKIPLGNGGNVTAKPQSGVAVVRNAGAKGNALDNFANTGLEITSRVEATARAEQNQAERDAKQRRDEMARAKTANAVLDHEIYSKTAAQNVSDRVSRGEIPYAEADKVLQDELKKAPAFKPDDADPVLAETYQRAIERNSFTAKSAVGQSADNAMRADYKAQFGGGLDKLGKLAGMPGADIEHINERASALIPIAKQAGVPDDQIGKTIQNFKDANWFNQASQLALQYSDSVDGLNRLKTELTTEKGYYADKLDPEKRTAIMKTIDANMDRLINRQQHLADKQEVIAGRAIGEIDQQIASSVPATPQQWLEWEQKVKGTPYEADFKARAKDEQQVQELLRKPIEEQLSFLQQKQVDMASNGADLRTQANFNRLKNAVDSNVKLLKESPIIFNQNRTGQTVAPLDFMGGDVATQLKDRFSTVAALRNKHGNEVALNPWLPQEAAQVKELLAKGDDKAKLALLGTIAQASPDGASYAGALKAVAADKGVIMLAGMAQYRGFKSSEGRDVASTLLAGSKVLEDKSVLMPTETVFKSAFEERIGDALPNGSPQREQAYTAFKAIYAGMAADKGVRHTVDNKEADEQLADLAASLTTGGISEYNGRKVMRPYGMPENDFEQKVDVSLEAIATSTGYPKGDIEDMPLIPVPGKEGLYYLMNGKKVLPGKDGQPVMVNVQ